MHSDPVAPIHSGGSSTKSPARIHTSLKSTNAVSMIHTAGHSRKAILYIALWYLFSGVTLFLNKYIVAYLKGDPLCLGYFLMWMTLVCAFIQMHLPMASFKAARSKEKPAGFVRHMAIVGTLRFTTVFLGLVALDYVEVSFTETVKSTAPAFTVIIARLMVGETTGPLVNLSLLPVMGGLVLCSANELSFNLSGFIAALATNASECTQNVYSKMLISGKAHRYSPVEMQFYTSLASLAIQLVTAVYFLDLSRTYSQMTGTLFTLFLMNGLFFYLQTLSEYLLMEFISPVTHSVVNTAKRALLIWLSVFLFGNPVTLLSGLGTCIVLIGVLLYTKARDLDSRRPAALAAPGQPV